MKFVWYLLYKTTGAFYVWLKALFNDFVTELFKKKQYSRDITPLDTINFLKLTATCTRFCSL